MRIPFTALVALLALAPYAGQAGGDVQSWNSVDYTVLDVGRVEWEVSGGLRFRDNLGDLFDRRVKTKVEVELGRGVIARSGLMVRNRDFAGGDTINEGRFSAGVEYLLLTRGDLSLAGITLYERQFARDPIPDFNRYRQRFVLGSEKPGFSPLLYQDFTFLQDTGFLRSRSRAGIRWQSKSWFALEVAYQFETINVPGISTWFPRHAILTSFEIDRPIWSSKR